MRIYSSRLILLKEMISSKSPSKCQSLQSITSKVIQLAPERPMERDYSRPD